MYIIHVANKPLFENEIKSGAYGSESLKRCGFIHCSDLDTYYLVAPNFKDDPDEKVILLIDTGKLDCDVRWEDGRGLVVTPGRGRYAMVDGEEATWRSPRLMGHGSVLQVGRATLRLRLFAGLDASYHARFQEDILAAAAPGSRPEPSPEEVQP